MCVSTLPTGNQPIIITEKGAFKCEREVKQQQQQKKPTTSADDAQLKPCLFGLKAAIKSKNASCLDLERFSSFTHEFKKHPNVGFTLGCAQTPPLQMRLAIIWNQNLPVPLCQIQRWTRHGAGSVPAMQPSHRPGRLIRGLPPPPGGAVKTSAGGALEQPGHHQHDQLTRDLNAG